MTTNDRIDEIVAEISIMLSSCGQPITDATKACIYDAVQQAIYLAPGAPAARTVRDAIDTIETMGREADTTRYMDYTHVSDGLTEIEVSDDGGWSLHSTPLSIIDASAYLGQSVAGAIKAGDMAAGDRYGALVALLRAGDYLDAHWEDIVTDLTDMEIVSGAGGTRAYSPSGEHAGVAVTDCGEHWAIVDLQTMRRYIVQSHIAVAARAIDTIYR